MKPPAPTSHLLEAEIRTGTPVVVRAFLYGSYPYRAVLAALGLAPEE